MMVLIKGSSNTDYDQLSDKEFKQSKPADKQMNNLKRTPTWQSSCLLLYLVVWYDLLIV